MTVSRPLVVVPTFNEAENIVELLDQVLVAAPEVDVLVVDDSSPDHTGDLVSSHPGFGSRVHLLTRPGKAGLGVAYRAGFTWALDRDYDAVVQMDADFSHPPARLSALIGALADHDVAIGSRYVPGGGIENWARSRRIISRVGNWYVAKVLGLPVRDATAGFKAFRRTALATIGAVSSQSNGYCFQIENTWQASREGLSVVEVPITFTERARGKSKMSSAIVLEAIIRVLGWRWRDRGFLKRRAAR